HTQTHTHRHTHTDTHTQTHRHARTHAHTHTHKPFSQALFQESCHRSTTLWPVVLPHTTATQTLHVLQCPGVAVRRRGRALACVDCTMWRRRTPAGRGRGINW